MEETMFSFLKNTAEYRIETRETHKWKKPLVTFFAEHPTARAIYDEIYKYEWTYLDKKQTKFYIEDDPSLFRKGAALEEALFQKLLELGVKAIIYDVYELFVFTSEMVMVFCGPTGVTPTIYTAPNKDRFMRCIHREDRTQVTGYTLNMPGKQKSVIGSAVAGGIVAGGVGAVVGAVAAANHNNTVKPTKKTFCQVQKTGGYMTYYEHPYDTSRMIFDLWENHPDWNMRFYVADGITLDGNGIDIVISNLIDQIWK